MPENKPEKKTNSALVLVAIVILAVISIYLNVQHKSTSTYRVVEPPPADIATEVASYQDGTNGFLARPLGTGPWPALILIHEWWGLNDNIRNLAKDFARQGYVALAVDLYRGQVASTTEQARTLAGSVSGDTDLAFVNLDNALTYLKDLSYVDNDSLASVGWCFGGGWAYQMAKNDLGVKASVMYYGRFSPEDDLTMMRADILGHFGEDDTSIAIDDVEQFQANLKTTDGNHAVYIYPNAGHAFANADNQETYNQSASDLAWSRTLDFLARELTPNKPVITNENNEQENI